jgi:hypothetical protein
MRSEFTATPRPAKAIARPRPKRSRRSWKNGIALVALMLVPALCMAHKPSRQECREGGDFIKNAALARDRGMPEANFIGQIQDDIEVIKSFPPQMRWFVQDDEAAEFLLAAAIDVFRNPRAAPAHQAEFIKACLKKVNGKSSMQI